MIEYQWLAGQPYGQEGITMISKEEFIAVVKAASKMISEALIACSDMEEKFIDVCCIDNRIQFHTSNLGNVTISGNKGYDPLDNNIWNIKEVVHDEEDA